MREPEGVDLGEYSRRVKSVEVHIIGDDVACEFHRVHANLKLVDFHPYILPTPMFLHIR